MSATLEQSQLAALLLNQRDAAHMLAISERYLWDLTSPRGPIPSVRIGKSVRYSVDALQRWIAGQSS